MYYNFKKIPDDERKKIINVCLEEFAKKGYEKAVSVILMFLDGFLSKHINTFKQCTPSEALSSYKKLSSEIKEYFEILKKGIYK